MRGGGDGMRREEGRGSWKRRGREGEKGEGVNAPLGFRPYSTIVRPLAIKCISLPACNVLYSHDTNLITFLVP